MISDIQLRNHIFKGAPLPQKCLKEMIEMGAKTIERAVYKANKQIEESKLTLNEQSARGVLFLANDGNYFFKNEDFLYIISNLIFRKFKNPAFDVIIYFTINQVTRKDESDLDFTFWAPIYTRIDENGETIKDEKLFHFVNDIGRKFGNEFFRLKSGLPLSEHKEIDNLRETIEEMKKHTYIPKEIIFAKRLE